jgi:hypothetical protein
MSLPAILFVLLSNPAQTPPPGPPRLEIESYPAEDSGTMHYAARTVIRLAGASPLEVSAEDEDTQQPILEKQFALTDSRFLVLGFSSEGAGMQTIHALLIENVANRLVIKDELKFHSAATFPVFWCGAGGRSRGWASSGLPRSISNLRRVIPGP